MTPPRRRHAPLGLYECKEVPELRGGVSHCPKGVVACKASLCNHSSDLSLPHFSRLNTIVESSFLIIDDSLPTFPLHPSAGVGG